MKLYTIILALIVFTYINAHAQYTKEYNARRMDASPTGESANRYGNIDNQETAGNELIKFYSTFSSGTLLSVTGTAMLIYNSTENPNSSNKGLRNMGIALTAAGTIIQFVSFRHIKKAGILLNENGIGVSIPITSD